MRPRSVEGLAVLTLMAATWAGPSSIAHAQAAPPPAPEHPIPQSLVVEHRETLERLDILAKRPGAVGFEARKAIVLFKRHFAREQEYILPPLTLLPTLAEGKVTPDMQWALAMCDRVKADEAVIFQEHTQITDTANALFNAGQHAKDKEAIEFARAAVADSLNDLELLEPTVLVIGDYLRTRLSAAH